MVVKIVETEVMDYIIETTTIHQVLLASLCVAVFTFLLQ